MVAGVGSIGERHVRCFQATGRTEVSVCDVDEALLRRIQSRYQVAHARTDLAAALDDALDAVVIATPAHLHVRMATEAVSRGFHALIEKPLSINLDGISQLEQLVADQQVTAMVAYVMRSHPALESMRAAITSERFGVPLHLYATGGQHFPTYRPAYQNIYYRSRETGGGAVQDALTHVLNAGQWLVGPVHDLAADATHMSLAGVEVEDTVNVIARHGSVLASYAYNQHQAPNELTITVCCERGTARFEYHKARWCWMTKPDDPWKEESVDDFQRDTIFVRQAHSFLDAIEGRRLPVCSLDEGVETLKTNRAVLRAIESREWVSPLSE